MAWRQNASFGKVKASSILGAADVIPPSGTAGYNPGATVILKNPVLGQSVRWVNQGSLGSCLFVPDGPSFGYGIFAGGTQPAVTAVTATSIIGPWANTDIGFAGHCKTDDVDFISSAIITDDTNSFLVTGSADPISAHAYAYAILRNKCIPTWDIAFAGTAAATAATTTAITVTGVLATDIAFAWYTVTDDVDHIAQAVCTANTITVKHSTTSSTGHTIGYMVYRPRGTFKPSHYIAFAGTGVATTADASAPCENALTLAGALATDLAYAVTSVNGATGQICRTTMSANTLTLQFVADPSTTSAFSYMVIRAY